MTYSKDRKSMACGPEVAREKTEGTRKIKIFVNYPLYILFLFLIINT